MNFVAGNFYQHRHGGIYYAIDKAINTETKEELAVYRHVFPFEETLYARPILEFTSDRFTLLSEEEVFSILESDRQTLKNHITKSRANG